jgi:protein phosphatase
VGDSRIYLARDGVFHQLTSDHSWVNEQIQNGIISADQARTHPLRNVVTRALGGRSDIEVDIQEFEARESDVLLLCSDGLTTMLPDEEIARCVEEAVSDVEQVAHSLVTAANERGGEDNITVLLIRFEP